MSTDQIRRLQRQLLTKADFCLDVLELKYLLHGLVHPGLIIHDPDDRVIPISEGRTLAANWPGAELRLFPGLGHNRILRDKSVVGEVVEFLRHAVGH